MSLSTRLVILGVLFLVISGKFSESPSYQFMAYDSSKGMILDQFILSTDEDKIAIVSQNISAGGYHQDIFNFDGTKACQIDTTINQILIGWPSQTSGLYYDDFNNKILKANSPCASLAHLIDPPGHPLRVQFTVRRNESFAAIAFTNNRLIEYNLESGHVSRQFEINNSSGFVRFIGYSSDHNYLYAEIETNPSFSFKVVVFDVNSGDRNKQINTDLLFAKGLSDGNAFIAADLTTNSFFNVDKNGRKKQIWTPSTSYNIIEVPIAICTNDNRLLSIKVIGPQENREVELISYDTDDGSVSQTITLNFQPLLQVRVACNDNYLAMMDKLGIVHIFKYTHDNPDPDPHPDTDPDSFPVWAIILIIVGSLLIVGVVVGSIIYKRKISLKQGSYQQFNNEEKSRNDL